MSTDNQGTYVRVLYPGGRITIEIDGLPLFDGRRGLVVDTRKEFPETTPEQAWLLAKNLVDDLREAPETVEAPPFPYLDLLRPGDVPAR